MNRKQLNLNLTFFSSFYYDVNTLQIVLFWIITKMSLICNVSFCHLFHYSIEYVGLKMWPWALLDVLHIHSCECYIQESPFEWISSNTRVMWKMIGWQHSDVLYQKGQILTSLWHPNVSKTISQRRRDCSRISYLVTY